MKAPTRRGCLLISVAICLMLPAGLRAGSNSSDEILQKWGLSDESLTELLTGTSDNENELTTGWMVRESDLGLKGKNFLLAMLDRHVPVSEGGTIIVGVIDSDKHRVILKDASRVREESIDEIDVFRLFREDDRLTFSIQFTSTWCCGDSETLQSWYRPEVDKAGQVSISPVWSGKLREARGNEIEGLPSSTCGEMLGMGGGHFAFRSKTAYAIVGQGGASDVQPECEYLTSIDDLAFGAPDCLGDNSFAGIVTATVQSWRWNAVSQALECEKTRTAVVSRCEVAGFPFDLPKSGRQWRLSAVSNGSVLVPERKASGTRTKTFHKKSAETEASNAPVGSPSRQRIARLVADADLSIAISDTNETKPALVRPFSITFPVEAIESLGWSTDSRFAFFVLATDKFRALYSVDAKSGDGHFEGFRPLEEHWSNGFVLEPVAEKAK